MVNININYEPRRRRRRYRSGRRSFGRAARFADYKPTPPGRGDRPAWNPVNYPDRWQPGDWRPAPGTKLLGMRGFGFGSSFSSSTWGGMRPMVEVFS